MALAPRPSLRSMVLLLSHGKTRLSSFFSSIPTATTRSDTPAAPTVKPPASRGGDTPVDPAVQPPPAQVPRSPMTYHSNVAPQEGALHRVPEDPFGTLQTQTHNHKPSSKKHPNNHEVCQDPDLGVAEGGTRISSRDKPPHPTRISSRDKPPHPTPEPVGRARIRNDAIDKHSACGGLPEDPQRSIPGGSCSTSQPLPDKLPKEDRDRPVAGGAFSSSKDNPGHPVPEP